MFKKKKSEGMNNSFKIVVFIDAGNLWGVYKKIGKGLALEKLKSFFSQKFGGEIFQIFYYVAYPESGTRSPDKIRRFHNFLTYLKKGLGFSVVKKPLKIIFLRDDNGDLIYNKKTGKPESIEKGNIDVEFTIDAIRYSTAYNITVFITGDSDFLPLVSYLRNLGQHDKKVYIFSTKGCISNELRTGADGYFDIKNFPEIHGNNLGK